VAHMYGIGDLLLSIATPLRLLVSAEANIAAIAWSD